MIDTPFSTAIHVPAAERERLERMIRRAMTQSHVTVRVRADPMPWEVLFDVFREGDATQVFLIAEIDELADDIVLVIRPCMPKRSDDEVWCKALMLPNLFVLGMDEDTGGILLRTRFGAPTTTLN